MDDISEPLTEILTDSTKNNVDSASRGSVHLKVNPKSP
jgi:hypothetical protein